MIVSISLMRRRPDISLETFRAHWLDPHGRLTAKLPGTRHYVQNHVIDGPGTNEAARALALDGFPALSFDSPEARQAAHHSPEMAACNVDSRAFVGAVSRVITDDGGALPPSEPGLLKQVVLTLRGAALSDLASTPLHTRGLIAHRILEQAAAPNSTVPHHGIEVDAIHEIWVESEQDLIRNAAVLAHAGPGLATFQVQAHAFL